MNSTIFCHIRYCDQAFIPEITIIEDFHNDWNILYRLSLEDNEDKYLEALELLL